MSLLIPFFTTSTIAAVTPRVDEIGALLTARTFDRGGTEVGTFTDDTRPTGAQVSELVNMAVADLASRVGTDIPTRYQSEARRLAALQAAALVESSFFPREIETDRSAHRQYSAMFLAGVAQLRELATTPNALRLV